jgi:3-oxoacyl-[acyl-carrier-protein] synthase III
VGIRTRHIAGPDEPVDELAAHAAAKALAAAGLTPEETAGALIDAALASGGRDNVTAIVVDVLDAPDVADLEDTAPRPRR